MSRLSVNIICKNNSENLGRCVDSLYEHLVLEGDEIVIVDTGSSPEEFEKIKALEGTAPPGCELRVIDARHLAVDFRPYVKEWLPEFNEKLEADEAYGDGHSILSFAAARNVALEASKNEVIFWIDSDDVLEDQTQGAFRKSIDKNFKDQSAPKFDALFLDYGYAFAPDGAMTTLLRRERVFWRDRYAWLGRCHETACIRPGVAPAPITYVPDMPVRIKHIRNREAGTTISDIRNYVILRNEIEETAGNIDPRTLFYLGNAARGLQRYKEALKLYMTFDNQSGSVDDRYACSYYIANIYMMPEIQRPVDALDWFSKCVEIKAEDPRGYFGMARCYGSLARWREAVHWFEIGAKLPEPQTLHSFDPTHIYWLPYVMAAHMYKELNEPEKAIEAIKRAFAARPNFEESHKFAGLIEYWAYARKFNENTEFVLAHIPGGPPVQRSVMKAITKHIPQVPYECEKRGIGRPEQPDPRRPAKLGRVDIFCGATLEEWGPRNRDTGIGGSEKMVLIMAPRLQKLGYNVTVYAEILPDQRGVTKDGVRWEHWSSFDEKRPRDILVFWRNAAMAQVLKNPARRRVLWTHDVQGPGAYNEQLLHSITDFQYQSQFHAEPVKEIIPPTKLWIARNAIESGMYAPTTGDPKRVVFLSSPDRGLASALQIVAAAQQFDPEINVTVMYGFTPFYRKAIAQTPGYHRHCPDIGRDCSMDDYERYVWQLIDQTGARVIHRVGFKAVAEELQQAGIWCYPTRFPEISCMAAMESQAAGLIPICTDFGALSETILHQARKIIPALPPLVGEMTTEWLAQAAQQLVAASKISIDDPRRRTLSAAAKKAFSVRGLAKLWHRKLGESGVEGGPRAPRKRCVALAAR